MATEITKLSLNSLPTDLDYEDFISAHLLLGGYTLDRSRNTGTGFIND